MLTFAVHAGGSGLYKVVLLLHILAAIVGFGGVLLNGVYATMAKANPGPEGAAITRANFHVTSVWAERSIYGVFVFGLLLVPLSDGAIGFGDTWVWTSMALYVVGIGVAHAVLLPSGRRMVELSAAAAQADPSAGPPPQVGEMERLGKRLGAASGVNHLLLVVILGLMIWKPGA